MMKELDGICRENGIHYTLGGGTAIGAIRHRGFIPWDDDIDLYMTRDNWEKFKAAEAAGKFPPNRVIESAETDINYTNTIGRYVATDSSSVHSHQIIYNDPAGHVIDVFVFDPINLENYREFMEDLMLYSDLMDETKGYSSRFDMNLHRYPEALKRCEAGDKKQVIDELVASFSHMDDPGWKHYIMEWGVAPFLFPASIFDGGYIRVPFEDTTVEIVKNYTEYLIWQYGEDWQYIPEHNGREGHDAIFSNTIPYTVVRADYMPFIDADKVRKAYLRRKMRLLRANPYRRKSEDAELKEKAIACREQLLSKITGHALKAAWFEDYFSVQLSPEMAGRRDKHSTLRRYSYPVCVPIGEDLTVTAVQILMRTERMAKAKRLIDIYTGDFPENFRKKRRPSERLEELNEEILRTRELMNRLALAGRDGTGLDELCAELEEAYNQYPGNSYIIRLRIRALMMLRDRTPEEESVSSITDEISEAANLLECLCPEGSPAHAEAEKYLADINGADTEEYIRIYRETSNGCLKLEIADMLAAEGIGIPEEEPRESQTESSDSDEADRSEATEDEQTGGRAGMYDVAKDVYRKLSGRDDRLKEEAWEIACRTRDRVTLLEMYAGRLDELEQMKEDGEWDRLSEAMAPHQEAVLRNLGLGLGLCVHPRLQELQYELFRHEGREDTAAQVDALVPEAHRRPIAE